MALIRQCDKCGDPIKDERRLYGAEWSDENGLKVREFRSRVENGLSLDVIVSILPASGAVKPVDLCDTCFRTTAQEALRNPQFFPADALPDIGTE